MSTSKVYSSSLGREDRRSEFTEFYEAAYSTIVGELLAVTGGLDRARAVGAGSFSRAWQAWPAIRLLPEPEMWVREDAMKRAYAPPRSMRLLQRGLPPVEPVAFDPEDDVLVAALQRLPMAQRLPLVLHYMGGVPVPLIAVWARCTPIDVEILLDQGFDALVAILDWPVDEPGTIVEDEEYDWTAEALKDSAERLPQHITIPAPTAAFRHAAVVTLSRRGAPVSVAASVLLGLAVSLTLPGQPAAQATAFDTAPAAEEPRAAATVDLPATSVSGAALPPATTAQQRRAAVVVARTLAATPSSPPAASASPGLPTPVAPVLASSSPAPTTTPVPTTTLIPLPRATSSASSTSIKQTEATESTITEDSEVETTPPLPSTSLRPSPTTTATTTSTSAEATPTGDDPTTTVLPITTTASND